MGVDECTTRACFWVYVGGVSTTLDTRAAGSNYNLNISIIIRQQDYISAMFGKAKRALQNLNFENILLKIRLWFLIEKPVKKIELFERSEFSIFRALMNRKKVRKIRRLNKVILPTQNSLLKR